MFKLHNQITLIDQLKTLFQGITDRGETFLKSPKIKQANDLVLVTQIGKITQIKERQGVYL